ncbi:MAG TPA: SIMPL domain-containing protein [Propionicimonas sp.]
MGLLRVSVDHVVRISAASARVHTRVRGSSLVATGVAGRKAAEVRDVLAALADRGISEDAVEVAGVRLTTSEGRILHGQSVDIQLVVTASPDQLPDLLGVLADRPGVAVENVEWVFDEFEASITAAAEAMKKARRKAEAIASAAGLEVAGIATASDSWSMPQTQAQFAGEGMMYAARASAAPLDLGVEINATTELSTHLSVDFELSP